MPDDGPFADEALADVVGFVYWTQERLSAGIIPEPDAGIGVFGELGGLHFGFLHASSGGLHPLCGGQLGEGCAKGLLALAG